MRVRGGVPLKDAGGIFITDAQNAFLLCFTSVSALQNPTWEVDKAGQAGV